jgi:hypothetical protein
MSSGGSNYSTGMTGGGNQVKIDSPASQQNGYGSAPAPGGKGGFPSAQNPYQQQPSVYMPPSQPSFYQQAFTQPRMEAPPRQYGLGGMGGGNAYARPYSPGSPIERAPPVDEMRYVSGPTPIQQRVMPDTPPMARPAVMPDRRYPVGPTPRMPDMPMNDMQLQIGTGAREYPGPMPDMRMSDPGRIALEATRGVVPEPNYSGGLGSLMGGMNDSVSYSLKPPPSGIGPLTYSNQKRMPPVTQEPYAGMYTGLNPQLLAQMQGAEFENQRKAADLQRLRSQPYDPRQLIG